MKTVTGSVNSAKPISLSKATTLLSGFVSSETQASQDVSAYLRRASAGFTELKSVHREIRSTNSNSEVRHPKKKKRKENKEEEDVAEEKLEDEQRNKERKSKDENVIDEEVKVKLEEDKKEKNRKSDGEIKGDRCLKLWFILGD